MLMSANEFPMNNGGAPDWKGAKLFQCVLGSGALLLSLGMTNGVIDAADAVIGFVVNVPTAQGGINLGVILICTHFTLYLLLDGVPKMFSTLTQVFLPGVCWNKNSFDGEGGVVRWSLDKDFQGIIHYWITKTTEGCQCMTEHAQCIMESSKTIFEKMFAPAIQVECVEKPKTECVTLEAEQAKEVILIAKNAEVRSTVNNDGGGNKIGTDVALTADKIARATHGEIVGDFKVIVIGRRRIDLSAKFKARSFLRFLHGVIKDSDGQFYVEEMRVVFNKRFEKGNESKMWKSDRFREDLFKGLKTGDFDLLFETVNQASGLYRLKI